MPHPATGLPVVGMVGAGQLARMTHEAASALGLTLRVLAASPDDGAALATPEVEIGAADDIDALLRFAKGCDVVTFDHEHVPQEAIAALEDAGAAVHPSSSALLHAQDKAVMRQRLGELDIAVPQWSTDPQALTPPYVVKARRGGYDGRGVWMVEPGEALPPLAADNVLVEERVLIVHEIAVMVARSATGEVRTWPAVQTVQSDGICVEVVAPAPRVSPATGQDATRLATRIAEELGVVGVMAVELFETTTGLVVNELAMRPHNSGHWTIEGSVTSQFAQHLRAVLGWSLGDTAPRAPVTVMVNLLGGDATDLARSLPAALAAAPSAAVHLYGKAARPGRKLGHVTCVGDDLEETRARAWRATEVLRGEA